MKKTPRLAFVLLAFGCLSRPALAAVDDVWVDADVNTRQVQLGEPFSLVVTAGARHGLVYLPGKNIVLPGCQILRYSEEEVSKKHEGYFARQGVYELAAFSIPDVIIPRLPVRFRFTEGRTQELDSLPIKLGIRSMNPEEGLSLIDPRPPHQPSRTWLLFITGAAAATALVVVLLHRRKTGKGAQKTAAPPAHLRAYKALATLEKQPPADSKEYFFELSRIVRQYLAVRFRFPAMEQSRLLIIATLERLNVEAKRRELINQILAEADLVKFGRETVSSAQKQQALAKAREMIELTREHPEPVKKRSAA